MTIERVIFKDCKEIQDTRFAPYVGEMAYVIDAEVIIRGEDIHTDFDLVAYPNIFEVIETIEA
jgi:hypothetical protein